MPYTSWSNKTIRTTIILGQGAFSSGGNTIIVEGLATDVSVEKSGTPSKNTADVTITGLALDDLAQITTLGFETGQNLKNGIIVEAGTYGEKLSTVFSGEIVSASADFNSAPDVPLQIKAMTGAYGSLIAKPPVSVKDDVAVADLIQQFATEAGYTFENQGVTASVKNAVFNGSPIEKACRAAEQAGIGMIIDDGAIVILPTGQPRKEAVSVELSAASGLIGYPVFDDTGIDLRTAYNPDIIYGGLVEVESIVPKASGKWVVIQIRHSLSAYHSKGGQWVTEIQATPYQQSSGATSTATITDNGTGANVGR